METANLLASSESDVGFMIDGLFSYELFGQTFWITTTHVAVLIVMLIILAFAVAARIHVAFCILCYQGRVSGVQSEA